MSCRAVGCTNRPSMQRSLHFFRFPSSEQDAGRLMKWLLNMRREDWKPTKSARLCSLHFEDHAFTTDSKGNRRLKNTAVPTVFTFPEHLVKKPTTRSTGQRLVVSSEQRHACFLISPSATVHPTASPTAQRVGSVSSEGSYIFESPGTCVGTVRWRNTGTR